MFNNAARVDENSFEKRRREKSIFRNMWAELKTFSFGMGYKIRRLLEKLRGSGFWMRGGEAVASLH